MEIEPVLLEGRHVRLEPLTEDHAGAFCEAGREWELTPEFVREGIARALEQQAAGEALPFATVARAEGRVVGGTRFLHIDPVRRSLEIGSSWIAAPWRRTAINTEAKFLMLRHAFERLGCARVEFTADAGNEVSRRAILRLGATEQIVPAGASERPDGPALDTVFYCILESEWPAVQGRLKGMMARGDRRGEFTW